MLRATVHWWKYWPVARHGRSPSKRDGPRTRGAAIEGCWLTTVTNVVPIREIFNPVSLSIETERAWDRFSLARILLAATRYLAANLCGAKSVVKMYARAEHVKVRSRTTTTRLAYIDSAFSGARLALFTFLPVFRSYLVYLLVRATESNSKMPFPRENTFRSSLVTVIYGRGWKARSPVDRSAEGTTRGSRFPPGKTRGRKCPSTIASSFFAIVTWMLNDDKTLDVTFTLCYRLYIGCCTTLSAILLWLRS